MTGLVTRDSLSDDFLKDVALGFHVNPCTAKAFPSGSRGT
jgi:hypothetical protein